MRTVRLLSRGSTLGCNPKSVVDSETIDRELDANLVLGRRLVVSRRGKAGQVPTVCYRRRRGVAATIAEEKSQLETMAGDYRSLKLERHQQQQRPFSAGEDARRGEIDNMQ